MLPVWSSHNYNSSVNSLTSIEESAPTEVSASNDTIVDTPSQTNVNTSQVSETEKILIKNLEKKYDLKIWWFRPWAIKLEIFNYQKPLSRERVSQK